MENVRIISDLHIDINQEYPISYDDDVFTIIAGDVSGDPKHTIDWIKKNIKRGILISGNHLPYNPRMQPIIELRKELQAAFPLNGDVTYLDSELGCVSKVVDGILFCGTCAYTDMKMKTLYNPDGDQEMNMKTVKQRMNDFKWGYLSNGIHITPLSYRDWFNDSIAQMDKVLSENESSSSPLPAIVFTHHPLISDYMDYTWYVEEDNASSYCSDKGEWLDKHPSIKAYCSGHIHAIAKDKRIMTRVHDDGNAYFLINNARGYASRCHDTHFNANLMLDVKSWQVVVPDEPQEVIDEKKKRQKYYEAISTLFI